MLTGKSERASWSREEELDELEKETNCSLGVGEEHVGVGGEESGERIGCNPGFVFKNTVSCWFVSKDTVWVVCTLSPDTSCCSAKLLSGTAGAEEPEARFLGSEALDPIKTSMMVKHRVGTYHRRNQFICGD